MEKNIFTIEQQKTLAKAIKCYFELCDVSWSSPRCCAKEFAHDTFRDLSIAASAAVKGGMFNIEDFRLEDHGADTKTLTEFLEEFDDDILFAAGVNPRNLKPSMKFLSTRMEANMPTAVTS